MTEIPPHTRLIAVSKTRSIAEIQAAFDAGITHFAESRLEELEQKISYFPSAIKWHYIGQLQGKKIKALASLRNLYMVQSVDSMDKAISLDFHRKTLPKLNVMVQVNVSGEKSGCQPESCIELGKFIQEKCWNLAFRGFMTIGAMENSLLPDSAPNPDYEKLAALRTEALQALSATSDSLRLSMGMTNDWRKAAALSADYIRLGRAIFGQVKAADAESELDAQRQQIFTQ